MDCLLNEFPLSTTNPTHININHISNIGFSKKTNIQQKMTRHAENDHKKKVTETSKNIREEMKTQNKSDHDFKKTSNKTT